MNRPVHESHDHAQLPFVSRAVLIASGIAIVIGAFWLVAWFSGVAPRWSAAGMLTVKTNTSLSAFAAGISLLLLHPSRVGNLRRWVGTAAAFLVLSVGALTLSEHLFRYNAGIDEVLAKEAPGALATSSPNRMGPPAALSFTLIGAGLICLPWTRRRTVPYLGLAVCLITFVPALGYFYRVAAFYQAPITVIAWPTVVALLALGTGLVVACPESGPMRLLLRNDAGGDLVRRLLPAMVLVPVVLGYVRTIGEGAGLYSAPTGRALLVLALSFTFSVLLWRSGWRLSHSAAAQKLAQHELIESERRYRELSEQLEERVRQRTAELQAVNKELEAFSYSVSHDLRAPLRTLDGFSQVLASNSHGLDSKGIHYVERIRAAAQKMRSLIDGMLQLSRLTRSEIQIQPVHLSEIAQAVVSELRASEPERNVKVCIKPDMQVMGDPLLLQAALENLLGNAWKFTAKRDEGMIEIGQTTNSGSNSVFFVRDNGAGFEMAHADRLFTPFQRLHTESDFQGTGIGLATVQRIVARHKGRIWAEATPGKGATFFFELGTNEEL